MSIDKGKEASAGKKPVGRRQLWKVLAGGCMQFVDEVRNSLGDLPLAPTAENASAQQIGSIPDPSMAGLIPVLKDGVTFENKNGTLWAKVPGKSDLVYLCNTDDVFLKTVVEKIDGVHTLATLSRMAAYDLDIDPLDGFRRVSQLYIRMQANGVCDRSN